MKQAKLFLKSIFQEYYLYDMSSLYSQDQQKKMLALYHQVFKSLWDVATLQRRGKETEQQCILHTKRFPSSRLHLLPSFRFLSVQQTSHSQNEHFRRSKHSPPWLSSQGIYHWKVLHRQLSHSHTLFCCRTCTYFIVIQRGIITERTDRREFHKAIILATFNKFVIFMPFRKKKGGRFKLVI